MTLVQLVPDADALLALEPEEIGGVLLEHRHHPSVGRGGQFHPLVVLPWITQHYPE